ncbi:S8 family peptidase [Tabrizicola sp.]|uniref:S8 family peptidase n=1 Tax=Tabrizicola sp. TaxID=2005166 RepID=UPI0025DF9E92|nr:S8 family peptidase [Tabrizicola sp.]
MSSLALLAACGGEDGDGSFTIFPDPGGLGVFGSYYMQSITDEWREAAASFRTNSPRFELQDGTFTINGNVVFANPLHSSRVDYAHAVGLSGAGQVIAVVDDGFLQGHEAFAGKNVTETGSPIVEFHGTMVASVAAGNSSTMVGVAPGADLIFSDWGNVVFDNLRLAAIEARRRGAVAQNNSWGFTSAFANSAGYTAIFGDSAGQAWLSALTNYALPSGSYEGGVVVFAISNNRFATQSGIMDALPVLNPTLETSWIAVGNAIPIFDDNGVSAVASRESSACLQAARWCMVADGTWVGAAEDGGYVQASGSSFAAPQVSGALALLAQAFPNLTPSELRARLLASADNAFTGFVSAGQVDLGGGFLHSYSTEFGHGFLDIRAALLPIGPTTLAMGDGATVKTQDYAFATGGAMGDAVTRSLEGVDLAVSDALGGEFDVAAKSFATAATPGDLAQTMAARSFGKDFRRARTAPVNPLADTFAAHPGQSMDLNGPEGTRATVLMGGAEDYGIALSQRVAEGGLSIDLGLKLARDGGSLMGFSGSGNSGGASMAAVTLALSTDTGAAGGFFALSGEMGVADLGSTTAITSTGQAQFNSLRLDLGGRGVLASNDRLTIGLSMPIAVTSGAADMRVPVSMADGGAEVRSVGIELSPQERQMELSIGYQVPMSDASEFMMELVRAENYGNIAGASDSAAVFGVKWSF